MMRPSQESIAILERPNPFEPRVLRSAIPYVPNQPLALYLKDVDKPVITLLDGRVIDAGRIDRDSVPVHEAAACIERNGTPPP